MKKLSIAALVVAGVFATISTGYADGPRRTRDPGINARQHHQQHRIRQGVRSGELTRRETARLASERRDIRQLERAYKSDGTFTRVERRDVQHELNQQSRAIYQQKHDDDTRL